jgi:hypothetical protein
LSEKVGVLHLMDSVTLLSDAKIVLLTRSMRDLKG